MRGNKKVVFGISAVNLTIFNREIPSLHAAALILGGAAFLSRLLGLLRDRLLAQRFGAGDALDAYYAAFQIPDILFTVFLIGSASAAVMPIFLEYEEKSGDEAEKFISNLVTVFGFAALAIAVLGIIFAAELTTVVAPGFSGEKLAITVSITRLVMVNAVLFGIAGILSSVLQARRRFFVFALPPIFYNLAIIASLFLFVPSLGVRGLGYGVLLGGLAQVFVGLPALAAMGFKFNPGFNWREPGLKRVAVVSLPRVLALSMNQVTVAALAAIASFFAAGSISVFKLASNLIYVPVGLFGVSYALAVFPRLSSASIRGQSQRFREDVAIGFRNILFWALPFTTLFIVLRAHIVRVVLGSGAFDWEDTRLVAAVLAVLAVAVTSESLLPLVTRAFYALGKTTKPLVWNVVASLLTIMLAVALAGLFAARPEVLSFLTRILRISDLTSPKIIAVAAAFAVGSVVNAALLALALKRAAGEKLGIELTYGGGEVSTMLGATVLGGLAAYLALIPFPSIVSTRTFIGILLQGAAAGAVGLAVYWLILLWQRNPEILGVLESLRRRLPSLKKIEGIYSAEKVDSTPGS